MTSKDGNFWVRISYSHPKMRTLCWRPLTLDCQILLNQVCFEPLYACWMFWFLGLGYNFDFSLCFTDERLNDIVGSAYYVAPEVLHRAYSTEADVWSVGVIAYILLCGSRPFWARTESGIFRAVLKADPSFDEPPWPSLSDEAKDFVKRLLNKDPRKRMTAAQALGEFLIYYLRVLVFLLFYSLQPTGSYCRSSMD